MFKKLQVLVAIILVGASTFYAGYYFGKRGFLISIKRNPPRVTVLNREPKDQTVDFDVFWQVWDVLNQKYIDRPIDPQKLVYGAVSGMVSAVGDDYTSFFTPEQNKMAKDSLNGSYEGVGAELGFREKQLIVIAPLEGSPAKEAGLLPGDKILEIDDVSTVGITLSDAVSRIRGDAGTQVALKIQRGDGEAKVYKITRGKIVSKSVDWKDLGDGIGYIRLTRFGDATTSEWSEVVGQMTSQMLNLKGVVLDLRGNPGGYLSGSVYVVSEFVSKGSVLFVENAEGDKEPDNVNRSGVLLKTPLVVLIDGGSASASEITAVALKELRGAKLVGTKSFGKGTIQTTEDFSDGSSLHVTIAKWLSPKSEWVHKVGIEPDVTVDRSQEDILTGKDPQLDKGKEVLLNAK